MNIELKANVAVKRQGIAKIIVYPLVFLKVLTIEQGVNLFMRITKVEVEINDSNP